MLLPHYAVMTIFTKLLFAKFLIKDSSDSSFLYKEIISINEMNNEIKLKITLNKIDGTLLYMFDKFDNQLIISLFDELEERMKIEFRGEEHYSNLSELCGCITCKYRLIQLVVKITDQIKVQCNDQPFKIFTYSHQLVINSAYPMTRPLNKSQAAIWLVNTPAHGEYYPNPLQLGGCIHEVSFNGKLLQMNRSGSAISTECPKVCNNYVCNTGVCYETYRTEPFCDCTDSFLNGPFCNSSSLDAKGLKGKKNPNIFKSKLIKISWRADSSNIFSIGNENIAVYIQAERNNLYLLYHDRIESFRTNKTITDKYQPNQNNILHLSFEAKFIGIKLVQNNTVILTNSFVHKDLSKEDFTKITKLSSSGFIDIVHKLRPSQYHWNSFNRIFFVHRNDSTFFTDNSKPFDLKQINKLEKDSRWNCADISIGVLSFLLVIIIILCAYLSIKLYLKTILKKCNRDRSSKLTKNFEEKSVESDSTDGSEKFSFEKNLI